MAAPSSLCCGGLLVCLLLAAALPAPVHALPLDRNGQVLLELQDPEYMLDLLNRLGHSIIRASEISNLVRSSPGSIKRGLDLGLGRGFSGSQAAKHLMGLSAATYAGGPGRRKRGTYNGLLLQHEDLTKGVTTTGDVNGPHNDQDIVADQALLARGSMGTGEEKVTGQESGKGAGPVAVGAVKPVATKGQKEWSGRR